MATTTSLDEATVKKVIRQVEFYFSDSNMSTDKFMTKSVSESEDGLLSLALICSFGKMKTHLGLGDVKQEDIPEDTIKAVAETLKTSSFLKISEDGKKVGRATPAPKFEEVIEQLVARTVAVSPLEYEVKLEEIESFFGQYAKVNSVRMPRHVSEKKLFCGTALIEFSTDEEAEKILKENLVFNGAELEIKPKKEFDEERAKQEEVEKTRVKAGSNGKNNSNAEPSYPKGVIVAFKLKSISGEGSEGQNGNEKPAEDSVDTKTEKTEKEGVNIEESEEKVMEDVEKDEDNNMEDVEEKEGKKEDESAIKKDETATKKDEETEGQKKPSAASLMDNKDVVLREDLKSVFGKFGNVKFVDFKMGLDSGYIRFEEAEEVEKARAAAALTEEGGLIVKNFIATLDPVTGEAEKEYWSLLRGGQDKHRGNFKGNRGRGGRHNNRGGRPNKFQRR